jgi:hypothetical protein
MSLCGHCSVVVLCRCMGLPAEERHLDLASPERRARFLQPREEEERAAAAEELDALRRKHAGSMG